MTTASPGLDELLRRTAAEIRQCRQMVVRLEDALHGLIDGGAPGQVAGMLADLQVIDLLDQRLNDLALWTEALARDCAGRAPRRTPGELAAPLLLAEMRSALAGLAQEAAAAAGHTEFF